MEVLQRPDQPVQLWPNHQPMHPSKGADLERLIGLCLHLGCLQDDRAVLLEGGPGDVVTRRQLKPGHLGPNRLLPLRLGFLEGGHVVLLGVGPIGPPM